MLRKSKFTDEERLKIESYIEKNMETMSPREILEALNGQGTSKNPLLITDVNNIKQKILRKKGALPARKRVRAKPDIEIDPENSDSVKEQSFTFEGLIEKMQQVIDYAKGIKEKQKKALEASFFS